MIKHKVSQFTTKQGTQIVCIDVPGARSCDVLLSLRAGYRTAVAEDETKPEVPHLLEHMVFEGSKHYASSDDLLDVFNLGGGETNGFTNAYLTTYAFHTGPEYFEQVLETAVDMVFQPLLDEKAFEEEREVIRNEHAESMTDFAGVAEMYAARVATGHVMLPPDIHLQLLDIPTLDDVRAYHAKFYTQANASVVMCRDFKGLSNEKLRQLLEKILKDVPVGTRTEFSPLKLQKFDSQFMYIPTNRVIGEDTLSLQFYYDSAPNDKELCARSLFCDIASNMKTYSINHRLRKRGLVYGLSVTGSQSIETQSIDLVISTAREKFPEVYGYTLQRLRELANDGIKPQQFENAKQSLMGNFREAIASQADALGWYADDYVLLGRCSSPSDLISVIEKMTQDEMLAIVRRMLEPDHAYGALMSPKPKRTIGMVVTLFDRIMRKGEDISSDMLADETILFGRGDRKAYRLLTVLASGVGMLLFVPSIVSWLFGENTLALTGDSQLFIFAIMGVMWVSLLILSFAEQLDGLRREAFGIGSWLLLVTIVLLVFRDEGEAIVWNAQMYLHLAALSTVMAFLIIPNTRSVIDGLKERFSSKADHH